MSAHFKIDTDLAVVFGDDINDLDMCNAIPEAKVAADFICDTNDRDGVAKWIEKVNF